MFRQNISSDSVPIVGYGYNFIFVNKISKMAILEFSSKITIVYDAYNDFTAGYQIEAVMNIFGYQNYEYLFGNWQQYNSNGNLIIDSVGFSPIFIPILNNKRLQFGRLYTNNRDSGGWSTNQFNENDYIIGKIVLKIS